MEGVIMPKKIILLCLIATALFTLTIAGQKSVEGKERLFRVKFVYDGDTILIDNNEKVRYIGINSPEIDHKGKKSEFMAHAAKDLNSRLVHGVQIILEYGPEKRDSYGRLLAYVFLKNGDMVNAIMARKGLAYIMLKRPNVKYKELFMECQQKAMKEKLGIWSRPFKKDEKLYLGNQNSFRFHRPSCPFAKKISRKNIIRFNTCYDAFWAGYSPCKRCCPAQR
jgi:endonuclease YncB( thermonuclease family)